MTRLTHSIIVALPGETRGNESLVAIREKVHELARKLETMLGLERDTLKGNTNTQGFNGVLAVTLPKDVSGHPNLLDAWGMIIALSKYIETTLNLPLRVSVDLVPTPAG